MCVGGGAKCFASFLTGAHTGLPSSIPHLAKKIPPPFSGVHRQLRRGLTSKSRTPLRYRSVSPGVVWRIRDSPVTERKTQDSHKLYYYMLYYYLYSVTLLSKVVGQGSGPVTELCIA